jgi:hypothetical protein
MQRGTKIVIALIVIASAFAAITLYAESNLRASFQKHLLVVRATNVVTSDAPTGTLIPADLGPHCAKAVWAQSGALIVDSDVIPADATGVAYIRYEPDGTFSSTGGNRVAVFFFRASGPEIGIASAADSARVLFRLGEQNSALLVNGTAYAVGQRFEGTYTTLAVVGTGTWRVQEAYTVTSLGTITVTVQPPQPCQ